MPKYDAFGTTLTIGARQVETATVVGTVTNAGNIHVVCTSTSLIAGSPLQTVVAVLLNDTADMVAEKIRVALNLVAAITLNYVVNGSGPEVVLTAKLAAANDGNLNIDYHMDGATAGLTDDLTSTGTTAGIAATTIAAVSDFGGPGLSMDTDDVTTHDSGAAWEEHVGTVLRSGELTLEIVYDPVADTHDATATTGLAYAVANKVLRQFTLTFPDTGPTDWIFDGYVTGFEPSEPVDGALAASITIKITGAPTLV